MNPTVPFTVPGDLATVWRRFVAVTIVQTGVVATQLRILTSLRLHRVRFLQFRRVLVRVARDRKAIEIIPDGAIAKAEAAQYTNDGGNMVSNQFFQEWSPRLLSVLRIVTALLFMMHGTAKLFQIPHQAMFDNLQLISLMGLQGVLEAGGGLLLLIGLFSRPVAFVLSGDMAVAYFIALAEELVADPQRRRPCRSVLLRIPLSVRSGSRTLEHRCATS
jgi:hypothetical protein